MTAAPGEGENETRRDGTRSGSVWPLALGGGITLLLFGLGSSYAFSFVGALLMATSILGWSRELLHREH